MNMQKRIYRWTLIFIGVLGGIMELGLIFTILLGISNKDAVLISVGAISAVFSVLVITMLIIHYRTLINFVYFKDENIVLVQNSGKEIVLHKSAVTKIKEMFSSIEIVCYQNGIQKTYRMMISFLPFKKYTPDIKKWKEQLPETYFVKSIV